MKKSKYGIFGWFGIIFIFNEVVEFFCQVCLFLFELNLNLKMDILLEELIMELCNSYMLNVDDKEVCCNILVIKLKYLIVFQDLISIDIVKGKDCRYSKWKNDDCLLENFVFGDGFIKFLEEREIIFWK